MKYSFLLIASLALSHPVQDKALDREAAVDGVEGANVGGWSVSILKTRNRLCCASGQSLAAGT